MRFFRYFIRKSYGSKRWIVFLEGNFAFRFFSIILISAILNAKLII
jgi:hypothetical protein